MFIPLYDVTFVSIVRGLETVHRCLNKAKSHPDAATFPEARLAPDMQPLRLQVEHVCNSLHRQTNALTRRNLPEYEGVPDDANMDFLTSHLDEWIALGKSIKPEEILQGEDDKPRPMVVGTRRPVPGAPPHYILDNQALALGMMTNFYFHVVTAYDILRHKGVELGKADYVAATWMAELQRCGGLSSKISDHVEKAKVKGQKD